MTIHQFKQIIEALDRKLVCSMALVLASIPNVFIWPVLFDPNSDLTIQVFFWKHLKFCIVILFLWFQFQFSVYAYGLGKKKNKETKDKLRRLGLGFFYWGPMILSSASLIMGIININPFVFSGIYQMSLLALSTRFFELYVHPWIERKFPKLCNSSSHVSINM
ncbi:MAG: hypothetical protein CMJ19_04660 [Phycisphaeraceae bacterium]|nr:hypothetical protein [Phycisphaeraceae bacterium]